MSFWKGGKLASKAGYPLCFACGQENPIGFKLRFRQEGDEVRSEFTPGEYHQGWPGIVHGGVIHTLLDEAMAYVPHFMGFHCVTAKMESRIRQPVAIGQRLLIVSNATRKTRRVIEAEAKLTFEDGTTVAEGKAVMYVVEKRERR